MSSFRRKGPSAAPARSGTKPFLNGQTLVSSGLSQLDLALGGGLLLRTLNLLETPPSSDMSVDVGAGASQVLAVDLLRYFVAEAVADGKQRVAVVAPDADAFVREQLPLELSLAQKQVKQQLQNKDDNKELTIAWQYGKYDHKHKQQQRRFCHSFDLSRKMHKEMLTANAPITIDPLIWMERKSMTSDATLYEHLYEKLEDVVRGLKEDGDDPVLRVALMDLGSPLFGAADETHMTSLVWFFRRLRVLLSRSNGVVCLAVLGSDVLSAFPAALGNELRHISDAVLTLNTFAGTRDLLPEELEEFQGSLTLRKLPRLHALACHAPSNTRFGVKRERRKVKIEKFHLPPEGSRSSSSNNSSSTGCRAPSSVNDPLAF